MVVLLPAPPCGRIFFIWPWFSSLRLVTPLDVWPTAGTVMRAQDWPRLRACARTMIHLEKQVCTYCRENMHVKEGCPPAVAGTGEQKQVLMRYRGYS
mmetsp:Transcript_46707/g.117592  ORF Transcript_46707/g.117592 Transcript_46707/m.117592 type:complete len:97 (-) Transcript_46707:1668-1958(-)